MKSYYIYSFDIETQSANYGNGYYLQILKAKNPIDALRQAYNVFDVNWSNYFKNLCYYAEPCL